MGLGVAVSDRPSRYEGLGFNPNSCKFELSIVEIDDQIVQCGGRVNKVDEIYVVNICFPCHMTTDVSYCQGQTHDFKVGLENIKKEFDK